jgi:hypothetical protein
MAEEKVSDKEAKERIRTCLKKSGSECDDIYTYLVQKGLPDDAVKNLWLEVSKEIQKDAEANADKQKKQKVKVTYVWYQFEDLAEFENYKTDHQKPDPSRCLDNQKEANVREKVTAKIDIGRIKWKAGKAVIGLGASTDRNYWYWNAREFELKGPVQGKPVITSINNGKPIDYTVEHVPVAGQFLDNVAGGITQVDPSTSADIGRIIIIPLKDLNYLTIEATAATFVIPQNLQDGHYWLVLGNNLGTASKDFELKRTVPAEGWAVKIMKPKNDGAELEKTHPFGDFYIGFHILGIDIRQIESIQLVVVGPNKRFEHNARVDKLKMVPLGSPFSYSVAEGLAQNIIDQLVVGEEYKITLIVRDKFHASKFDTKRVKVVGPKTPPKPEEKEEVEKIKKDLDKIEKDRKELAETEKETDKEIERTAPKDNALLKTLRSVLQKLMAIRGKTFVDTAVTALAIEELKKAKSQLKELRKSVNKVVTDVSNREFVVLRAEIKDFEKLVFDLRALAIEIQNSLADRGLKKDGDPRSGPWWERAQMAAGQLQMLTMLRKNYMDRIQTQLLPLLDEKQGLPQNEETVLNLIIADLEAAGDKPLMLEGAIQNLNSLIDHFVAIVTTLANIRKLLKEVDAYEKQIDIRTTKKWLEDFIMKPVDENYMREYDAKTKE